MSIDNKMTMEILDKEHKIDRKAASRLLKMSIRTVDRYVKDKKLSTRVVDGRIWLSRKEINDFRHRKESPITVDNVDMSTPKMSIDNLADNVDISRHEFVDTLSTTPRKIREKDDEIYKKLYSEMKEDIKEKQERLEIANYRVGQLEAQLRGSIPMLEFHRQNYEKEKKEEEFKNKIGEYEKERKGLFQKIRYEAFSKRIFLAILLIIIALQPLWLLLLYK
ncbi:hypothetical protein HZC20_03270 [Candidatus Peregrinibacteria bacterium]|nr:hypothetical protein [Candidatus Peregrinibacteria bacterium]